MSNLFAHEVASPGNSACTARSICRRAASHGCNVKDSAAPAVFRVAGSIVRAKAVVGHFRSFRQSAKIHAMRTFKAVSVALILVTGHGAIAADSSTGEGRGCP